MMHLDKVGLKLGYSAERERFRTQAVQEDPAKTQPRPAYKHLRLTPNSWRTK